MVKIKKNRFVLFCYIAFVRLKVSYRYKKETFSINDSNPFFQIYMENRWNSEESVSGVGSTLSATAGLRDVLPIIFRKYSIHSILDIPCGDYNWMRLVDKDNIKYIGADIIEPLIEKNQQKYSANNVTFKVLDITKDQLPQVDLIFCKDCLQHLSDMNIQKALNNIRKSGATYLMTNSFPLTLRNWDIKDGDYRPLNLKRTPFCLPNHIFKIHEFSGFYSDATMYLWKISDLIDSYK